jgi:polysaccharide export outer membrane protein
VTSIGTLGFIRVKSGETIVEFDTYLLPMRGDVSLDVRLQSGDVVFVPPYEVLRSLRTMLNVQ